MAPVDSRESGQDSSLLWKRQTTETQKRHNHPYQEDFYGFHLAVQSSHCTSELSCSGAGKAAGLLIDMMGYGSQFLN